MALTGYSANLPTDTLLDSGVLFAGSLAVGATKGAPSFDPGIEMTPIDFDGRTSDILGLDRITAYASKITATLIEFGGTATGAQIAKLAPGSVQAVPDQSGTTVITPKPAATFIATGDHVSDLRLVFQRGGGGYAAIHFAKALCTKWDVTGTVKGQAVISSEFTAKLDLSVSGAQPSDCPFDIELRTALP